MSTWLKPTICGIALFVVLLCASVPVRAQERAREATAPADPTQQRLRQLEEELNFMEQTLRKDIDDLMWVQRLQDIAVVDKVRYTSLPARVVNNPTGQGREQPAHHPRLYISAKANGGQCQVAAHSVGTRRRARQF
jgi:hypothetical protein